VVGAEHERHAFDARVEPVLTVEPGATVTFETSDLTFQRLDAGERPDEIGLENFNGVTGPVAIAGAEPGDALRIEILDVAVERAWAAWLPDFGGLGARTQELQVRSVPLVDREAHITEALTVPVEPMIGCIGVAPAEGTGSTLQPASVWGGNMDLRELSPGATLFLPVQVSGALLSVGDLHAAMGTAEPTHVSLEAAGKATLRIALERGMRLPSPRLRVGKSTMCLGLGATFDEAQQSAIDQAYELLIALGLQPFGAYAYTSARVSLRLGGPASPMVLAVVPDLDSG
jgi:amidase